MKKLSHSVQKFLDHVRATKSPATFRQYYYDMKSFASWIETKKGAINEDILCSLKPKDYEEYLEGIADGSSDALVRRKTSILNQWLKFLGSEKKFEVSKIDPPAAPQRPLTDEDFVSEKEMERLLDSMHRFHHRSADEAEVWTRLVNRNILIITLLYQYGLTVREICDMNMEDVNMTQGDMRVTRRNGTILRFTLSPDERKRLVDYYNDIPERLRPRRYSSDPLFIAFSYAKKEFKWDYIESQPKRIGVAAIHKMIKIEARRAGLRPINATNMRNARILAHLKDKKLDVEILQYFGLDNWRALLRYKKYLRSEI
ncbi:hypothetical protein GFC29_3838 (plasmid) [Anoxybacillus sp. B7M1]|uniref:tyrosine-type recombinase/integrase n=1 Tax=Anoxybacillus sp. B7M1 TaxID=1490057 RepID=UPI0005CD05D1|nr:tyrosine-type recombinase/integrase [Anoxybacillus sp. B7M1]ANB66153.1 hypothetical protein GFC29_3838 [Anoxybacillus sp. B7M1]